MGNWSAKKGIPYVDDLAEACLLLMNTYNEKQFVNVGTGEDLTIRELAELIKEISGFEGDLLFDTSKPDGTMRKLMDVSIVKSLGWQPNVSLKEGIEQVYKEYSDSLS